MSVRYVKVAPVDFEDTVLDTDDLSTIRGSSLTWAAMPRLLDRHLATLPEADGYERILSSASELVFRVGKPEDGILPLPEKDWPKKGKNTRWKALRKAAENVDATTSDEELRALAAATPIKDWKPDQVLGALAWLRGSEPTAEAGGPDALGAAIDAFLAEERTEDGGTRWPFDTMHFAHASLPASPVVRPTAILDALDTRIALARATKRGCAAPLEGPQGRPCAFTGTLPAGSGMVNGRAIAAPVFRRREVGRMQKKTFYRDVLKTAQDTVDDALLKNNDAAKALDRARHATAQALQRLEEFEFASEFGDIVGDAPTDRSLSVQGSLALLALDGNGFGAHRDAACKAGFSGLKRFSRTVDGLTAGLLARLLLAIADDPDLQHQGTARFETLLWGADEFTFVAPGWAGWRLADLVLEEMADWVHPSTGDPLTFGMGLLFAPAKAPIRTTNTLAQDLMYRAKKDKMTSRFQVLAVEGFDHADLSAEALYKLWLGDGQYDCAMSREALTSLPRQAKCLLATVGRGAVAKWVGQHRLALGAPAGSSEASQAKAAIVEDAKRIASDKGAAIADILENPSFAAGHPLVALAHLALMIDYLPVGAADD